MRACKRRRSGSFEASRPSLAKALASVSELWSFGRRSPPPPPPPPGRAPRAQVVKNINMRRDPDMAAIPVKQLMPKNIRVGRSYKDPFSGDNARCLDAVSRWHACDIEKFGFARGAGANGTGQDVSRN